METLAEHRTIAHKVDERQPDTYKLSVSSKKGKPYLLNLIYERGILSLVRVLDHSSSVSVRIRPDSLGQLKLP